MKSIKICVVAGTHGDEYRLGAMVHRILGKEAASNIYLLAGNPYAVELDTRFIDSDLNRSFSGKTSGYEAKRSQEIRDIFAREHFTHVIDIHTSPSTDKATGVLAYGATGPKTNEAINAFSDVTNIAQLPAVDVPHSLIGAFGDGGYALECPRYNEEEVARCISKGIIHLLNGGVLKRIVRTIHVVDSYVPTSIVLPGGSVRDFEELPEIGGYAFVATELYKQQGYGHQGMRASEKYEVVI